MTCNCAAFTSNLHKWCDDCLRRAGHITTLQERYAAIVPPLQQHIDCLVNDAAPLTHNPFVGLELV